MVGGAAVTEEIAPGFRASIFSYLMSLLHPKIIRDFELKRHGLEVLPCSDMVSPVGDGTDYILFSDNIAAHAGLVPQVFRQGRGDLPRVRQAT